MTLPMIPVSTHVSADPWWNVVVNAANKLTTDAGPIATRASNSSSVVDDSNIGNQALNSRVSALESKLPALAKPPMCNFIAPQSKTVYGAAFTDVPLTNGADGNSWAESFDPTGMWEPTLKGAKIKVAGVYQINAIASFYSDVAAERSKGDRAVLIGYYPYNSMTNSLGARNLGTIGGAYTVASRSGDITTVSLKPRYINLNVNDVLTLTVYVYTAASTYLYYSPLAPRTHMSLCLWRPS